MKASVPPTSFVTSISTLRALISRRIVLPTTIATASPSSAVAKSTSRPARASIARKPSHPLRVDLHELGLRQGADRLREGFDVALDAAGRVYDERVRQRIGVERIERFAETGLSAELYQRCVAVDDRHAGDVGALLDGPGRSPRGVLGDVQLQIDREVGGALPSVADGIRIVDGDAQPGRQRERGRDDEDREHARERLAMQVG